MDIAKIISIIMTVLFAGSEILGFIPSLKSNGIVQLIINLIKKLTGHA